MRLLMSLLPTPTQTQIAPTLDTLCRTASPRKEGARLKGLGGSATWLSLAALSISIATAGWVISGLGQPLQLMAYNSQGEPVQEQRDDIQPAFNPAEGAKKGGLLGMRANLVADVAERVAPSVVNIDIEQQAKLPPAIGDLPAFPFRGDDIFRRFFGFDPEGGFPGQPPANGRRVEIYGGPKVAGNGSGIVLDSNGHILTNNHVIQSATTIFVTLNDGRRLPARVVGKDAYTDLAILKVEANNLKPARFGNSNQLRPGEWVLAVGSPLGFDHTVTLGIVSALSRRIPNLNSNVDFIQTDAAINPGNSGGPLVNLDGEVVGINTAVSGRGQNIGFAIPVNVASEVADALIHHKEIARPWIGIGMLNLTPEVSKSLGVAESTQGVVVAQVMPGSPSFQAGFQPGDIIQRIEGTVITDAKQVQDVIKQKPINAPLHFQILRNGSLKALTVQTHRLPEEPHAPVR
ncbi:MAG: trypsin-like peptidase domain-containing protein [Candidatus Melainabacteria bacterium]|nr:trypsin-like peptidase domain-containing protein [Candidatus Melainabacteria bacterium]